jgi:hypothetical protein
MADEGELVQVEQAPRECCRDLANRGEPERVSDDLSFTRCVCGARHFVLTVDEVQAVGEGAAL